MNAHRRPAFLLAFALITGGAATTTGCASGGYPGLDQATNESQPVILRVNNNNWHDMRVYVVTESGQSRRVGMVTGMSSAVFRLRHHMTSGQTQILLRPIGTRATFVTNMVLVQPGSTAELTVQNQLSLSQLVIW